MSEAESTPPVSASGPSESVPRVVAWSSHILFLVVLSLGAAVLAWPKPDPDRAPRGELVDARGNDVELDERLKGVSLVHFWATWCPPCIAEVPSIRRLAEDHAADDFSLIMVAVADEVAKATEFLGDTETLFDPEWDLAHDYGTTKLPETHLVVDGKIVERFIGATDWDRPDVRAKVKAALDSV